jgi:uncharacterized membrane protein YdjX (TVP38/TMEM64 family)
VVPGTYCSSKFDFFLLKREQENKRDHLKAQTHIHIHTRTIQTIRMDERAILADENHHQEEEGEEATATTSLTEAHEEPRTAAPRWCPSSLTRKLSVGILLFATALFVIIDTLTHNHITSMTKDLLSWVQDHPAEGILLYTLAFSIAIVLFIPGTIFTLGAGFVFSRAFGLAKGMVVATLVTFVGSSTGAVASFLLGRYLFRDCLYPSLQQYKMLQVLDKAMHDHGFRIMVLLHLNPIIPFNLLSYLAGVTSIKSTVYAIALVGNLPGTVLYVFLGASAENLADLEHAGKSETLTLILLLVGLVFGFVVIWQMAQYAKQEIQQLEERYSLAEEEQVSSTTGHQGIMLESEAEEGEKDERRSIV